MAQPFSVKQKVMLSRDTAHIFACVFFLFLNKRFFTFGQAKGASRAVATPTNQSFRVCNDNLATHKVAITLRRHALSSCGTHILVQNALVSGFRVALRAELGERHTHQQRILNASQLIIRTRHCASGRTAWTNITGTIEFVSRDSCSCLGTLFFKRVWRSLVVTRKSQTV